MLPTNDSLVNPIVPDIPNWGCVLGTLDKRFVNCQLELAAYSVRYESRHPQRA